MALGRQMQGLRVDLTDHKPQVKFALREFLDFFFTDPAKIAFVTLCHASEP
jgi:hypothetical protein